MWRACATNSVGLMWQAMSQLALQRMVLSAQCCCPDSWWPCTAPILSTALAAQGRHEQDRQGHYLPLLPLSKRATFSGLCL